MRLKQDLESGRKPAMDDLIFEVDMENVVTDKANLFTLFHNLSDKTKTVVFESKHQISNRRIWH